MKSQSDSSDPLKKLVKKSAAVDASNSYESKKRIESEIKERERENHKKAYLSNTDDTLRFGDYYKMAASTWSYPNNFNIVQVFIPAMIFMIPQGFDFDDFLEQKINWNWYYLIVLYALFFLFPVAWSLVKAFRFRKVYNRLPFNIQGLGILVHRCKYLNYFRRCAVSIQFHKDIRLSKDELDKFQTNFLKIMIGEIRKISNGKYIFQDSGWSVKENKANGYANWESAGKILRSLNEYLAPVQKEHNCIASITIDFPSDKDKPDHFEWTAEGD